MRKLKFLSAKGREKERKTDRQTHGPAGRKTSEENKLKR